MNVWRQLSSSIWKLKNTITISTFSSYSTFHYNYNPPQQHQTKLQLVSTNIIITQHIKHGRIKQARKLFDQMRERTVVTWNILIYAYSKLGHFSKAFHLVWLMHHSSNVKFNESTFSSVLSACAHSQALIEGMQVHGLVLKSGCEFYRNAGSALVYFYSCCQIDEARKVFDSLHEVNEVVWSVMLVGYVQCSLMDEAMEIFTKMPKRDVVAWTTIISGYSKSAESCCKALELFKMMMRGEIVPNECTLDCVIRACGKLHNLLVGKSLHGLLVKLGYELEHSVSSSLIVFYCEIEKVDDAKMVYQGLVNPCTNNSNTLIVGLLKEKRVEEAELIFNGMLGKHSISYNLMINGYAMKGQIEQALELFQETKAERNPTTWNSMLSGFVQNDQHENAIKLYTSMRKSSVSPTWSTFSTLLRGCACLGSIQQGQIIHADLIKRSFESNVYVGTALVDMYSKCGSIVDARRSFVYISHPNVITWIAEVNGCVHHGMAYDAIILFEHMLDYHISQNAATFLGVLSACTRAGLVNEGMRFLNMMKDLRGIPLGVRHVTCMGDLLAESGHLLKA